MEELEQLSGFLKTTIEEWSGAEVYYREDWECDYFHVAGKYFALLVVADAQRPLLTIKGLPEKNEELRAMYPFIIPGYYANKTHWNSVLLKDSTLSREEVAHLMKTSYELVLPNCRKK